MNRYDPSLKKTFSAETSSGVLSINLDAIIENYKFLSQKAPSSTPSAVIKANAYGLGAKTIAPILEKQCHCQHFFVAHLQEAIALRSVLSTHTHIYVLNGLIDGTEPLCIEHNIIPVLNTVHHYKNWQKLAEQNNTSLPAALQLDSGMHRFGLSQADFSKLKADGFWRKHLDIRLIISHLACATEPNHAANFHQLELFKKLTADCPEIPLSLSASSGIFLGSDWHLDMVRPGAALYGINPTPGQPNPMKTVATVTGKIVQIRNVDANTAIGYSGAYVTPLPARLAIVGIGYADGFLRVLGNRAYAVLPQYPHIRLPIIGNISMDCLCVDISQLPEYLLSEGDSLEFIGPNVSLEYIGEEAKTIGYEILTALDGRLYKNYTHEHSVF